MDGPDTSSIVSSDARFKEIVRPLSAGFAGLEAFLREQIGEFEPEVQPLAEYCFGHSGKKLRPILVFSMALGSDGQFTEPVIKAAAIVELVHLATLVHDDILDQADTRHRTETVVAKFGSHVAVLLGDALFAHALHLAAQFPDVTVCRKVSESTRQVCSGEIAQTFSRGANVPSLEAYFRMIDLKTAELFSVSAFLGGYLSGFPQDVLVAAGKFARHLGIAYQMYDDAADIFGTESRAGKTLGTDLATGKYTLPVLLWLESLSRDDQEQMIREIGKNGGQVPGLLEQMRQLGVLDQVKVAFDEQIGLARTAVLEIPDPTRQAQLNRLAQFVESAWNKFTIK